jgi:uncharacterized C2H2 Zn-finger protein
MNTIELELQTINTVIYGLNQQIEILEERKKVILGTDSIKQFKCVECDMVFSSQEQLDRHRVGKKHNDKLGISPVKCSQCQNNFYGKDLVKHVEDGRCEQSRTCNGCRVIFNTMMRKSRHTCSKRYVDETDNCKNVTKKKKKLKITTKKKLPEPLPVVEEMPNPPAPPPSPEPIPVPVPEPIPVPVPEPKKESMFVYDKPKYTLGELPATLDNVNRDWYERLHSGIKDGDKYFYKMEESARCIDNLQDDTPMRLEDGIIYEKETGEAWFKMTNIEGQYYKLVDLDTTVPEPIVWPKLERIDIVNNLEPLYTIGEKDFDEVTYINLHQHAKDNNMEFLPAEMNSKFNENIADIMDSKYLSGEYMYYEDGFLWRGKDRLFRFFVHSSGLFYDIDACEINECDLDTEDELDLDEDLIN